MFYLHIALLLLMLSPLSGADEAILLKRAAFDSYSDDFILNRNPFAVNVLDVRDHLVREAHCYGLIDLASGYSSSAQTLQNISSVAPADQAFFGFLHANCLMDSGAGHTVRLDLQSSGTYFLNNHRTNSIFTDVTLPVSFYLGDYRLRFTPEGFTEDYNGASYLNAYGFNAELGREIGPVFIGLALGAFKIENVQSRSFSGYNQRAQISVQRRWASGPERPLVQHGAFLNGYVGALASEDPPIQQAAYRTVGLNAGYRLNLNLYDLILAGATERHVYTYAEPDTSARRDWKWTLEVQSGWRLREALRVYVDLNRTETHSNQNIRMTNSDRQFQIGLGAAAAF